MPYLFQRPSITQEQNIELSWETLWNTKMDFDRIRWNDVGGIGLEERLVVPYTPYDNGYLTSGIIDCGPNIKEYGRMLFKKDVSVMSGVTNITWIVRSSDDTYIWTEWEEALEDIPVQQFVQFKFIFWA